MVAAVLWSLRFSCDLGVRVLSALLPQLPSRGYLHVRGLMVASDLVVTSGLMVASDLGTCGLMVASDCDLELRFSCGDKPNTENVSRKCCDLRSAILRRQQIVAICDCDHKRAKISIHWC